MLPDGYPATSDGDPPCCAPTCSRVHAAKEQRIEIIGIGIRGDAVEALYPNAVVVRKLHELPATAFTMFAVC